MKKSSLWSGGVKLKMSEEEGTGVESLEELRSQALACVIWGHTEITQDDNRMMSEHGGRGDAVNLGGKLFNRGRG